MKILKETHSPMLSRRRIEILIDYSGMVTPNKQTVRKNLCEFLKVGEDTIYILHIYPKFGQASAKVIANIYKDKESLERAEIKKKKPKAKKEKAAAAPKK